MSERKRVQFVPEGESLTKQSFRDEADINVIMKRYAASGDLPGFNAAQGRYGDFSSVPDYHECLNRVREAEASFMRLPAEIRAKFAHDPGELLAAALDESRWPELEELGLVPPGRSAAPSPSASETGAGRELGSRQGEEASASRTASPAVKEGA